MDSKADRLVARGQELTRMFASSGGLVDKNRVRIFIEDTLKIPDRYFKESIRKAKRDNGTGFAPQVGEIWAAYRAINSSHAPDVAAEPQMDMLTLPGGPPELNPSKRTVQEPDRSQELPKGTKQKFDAKMRSRMNKYIDENRDKNLSIERAWSLSCQDISNENSEAGEFARRAWERHLAAIKHNDDLLSKGEHEAQTAQVARVVAVAQRIRKEGVLVDPDGPKRHLLSTIAAYHELGIPFPVDPITRSALDVHMRTFVRNGGDASWWKEARRAVA